MLKIVEDDLSGEPTCALIALHLRGARAVSPPESVYALDVHELLSPGVTVWSAWDGEEVVGVAALRACGPDAGEVKSMRTHPAHLRRGVAQALLHHIVVEARRRGLRRLSLETGSGPAFELALALYRRFGFENGPPFGDYAASAFNQFLHLRL